mmetsp:Transcript_24744/g.83162  ORF Transcript_24744/g.83162 Transcript_24744/m.83162 type:complete len:218 (+) Transcript_24744:571-1224(+)
MSTIESGWTCRRAIAARCRRRCRRDSSTSTASSHTRRTRRATRRRRRPRFRTTASPSKCRSSIAPTATTAPNTRCPSSASSSSTYTSMNGRPSSPCTSASWWPRRATSSRRSARTTKAATSTPAPMNPSSTSTSSATTTPGAARPRFTSQGPSRALSSCYFYGSCRGSRSGPRPSGDLVVSSAGTRQPRISEWGTRSAATRRPRSGAKTSGSDITLK